MWQNGTRHFDRAKKKDPTIDTLNWFLNLFRITRETRMRAKRVSEYWKIPQNSITFRKIELFCTLRHFAAFYSILCHFAEFCGILRHFAEFCGIFWHFATFCGILQKFLLSRKKLEFLAWKFKLNTKLKSGNDQALWKCVKIA